MLDNINIGSRFLQKIIEKTIEKVVYKSFGANVKIRFRDAICISTDGDSVKVHLNLDAETDKESIERLIES